LSENKENIQENIVEKAADGSKLVLPQNTQINWKFGCDAYTQKYSNQPELVKKDFPKFVKACQIKFQKKEGEELNDCVMNYFNTHISNCVEGSVHSFIVDGIKYASCFKIKTGGYYLNPEEMKLDGYFAPSLDASINDSGCKGKKWENFDGKSEKKYDTEIKPGQVIDNKSSGRVGNNIRYYLSGGEK